MSGIVLALEAAYDAIRGQCDEVPAALIVVGPSSDRRGLKLGHWAKESWAGEGEERLHELFMSAERLERPADEVFGTLLHEAAHALATARGIRDHAGQRHNGHFKAMATELGMKVERQGNRGWAKTTLTEETREKYAATIEALSAAIKAYRAPARVVRDHNKAYKAKVSSAKSMMRFLAVAEPRIFAELISELELECPHCGETL